MLAAQGSRVRCTDSGKAGRVSDSGRLGDDRRLNGRATEFSQIQSTDAVVHVPHCPLHEVSFCCAGFINLSTNIFTGLNDLQGGPKK